MHPPQCSKLLVFSAESVRERFEERFEENLTAKSKITRSKLDCLTSICPEIL